jgi:hypothetical protein
MSQSTLIAAIKELLEQWEESKSKAYSNGDYRAVGFIEKAIDDLKGILPPEEE